MAKLFDSELRLVPTWLAAARHLDGQPGRKALNLLLEIPDPLSITAEDQQVMNRVDEALAASDLTLKTVAGTIFPLALYKRYGRPAFYDKYIAMIARGKQAGTWGTYAARMIQRPGRKPGEHIYPLEMIVARLSAKGQPQKKSGSAVNFSSAYELGIVDPSEDLELAVPQGTEGDLPTYNASLDGREWLGFPCLSHVTFKRVACGASHAVNMTAIYRSHHYCARALGNLLGLAQLLSFVAQEAGLAPGTLTCVSSHAELDVNSWGGVARAKSVLA